MCGCGSNTCLGCGSLVVPEGPAGPTGPQGPAGADGADGANGAAGPTWMSWSWSRGSDLPHILAGGNAAFKVAAEVIYPGTSVVSIPTYVKMQSYGLGGGPNYDLQLYDVTNAKILASLNGRSQTSATIDTLTLGSAADWPLNTARVQIRVRDNNAASDQVIFYSMTWHN